MSDIDHVAELQKLRDAKGLSRDERRAVRNAMVAKYLEPRERITERTETVREQSIIQPIELDEEARKRLAQLEDVVAWLSEPVEPDEPAPVVPDLSAELEAALARIKELEAKVAAVDGAPLPGMDEKLWDYQEQQAEQDLTKDHLLDLVRADPDAAQDVIAKLSRQGRKRFTELLNVELAELQQVRGAQGEDLKREAEIEQLLGLFARVGEM